MFEASPFRVKSKERVRELLAERRGDETELRANAEIAEDLLEGDIVPTKEQLESLIQETTSAEEERKIRGKRKAIDGDKFRWPRDISYAFDSQNGSDPTQN